MSPRYNFDQQLKEIQQDILRLGSLVEQALFDSVQALVKLDVTAAGQIIMRDELIDQMCLEIEEKCVRIMATQ